jgi:hypothetical protein
MFPLLASRPAFFGRLFRLALFAIGLVPAVSTHGRADESAAAPVTTPLHRFIALDNGDNRLLHVDQTGTFPTWSVEIPFGGRDLQLLPDGKHLLLSHNTGLQIRRIEDGALSGLDVRGFSKVQSARALPDGSFLIAASDKTGFSLINLDPKGVETARRSLPGFPALRLLRPGSGADTYLITTEKPFRVAEVSGAGQELRTWPLRGKGYVAVLSADGVLHAPNGGACQVERFAADGSPLPPLGGKKGLPGLDWFSGCEVLPDNSVLVTNWMGHLPREQRQGPHLVHYAADGRVLWTWSDPAIAQVTNVLLLPDPRGQD